MGLRSDLCGIDGAILPASEIFVRRSELRVNYISGAFGDILGGSFFKWFSLDMGKRIDRDRVCHDVGSAKQCFFFWEGWPCLGSLQEA